MLDSTLDLGSDPKEDIKKQLNKITGGDLKWGLSAAGYLDSDIFSFFHDQDIKLYLRPILEQAKRNLEATKKRKKNKIKIVE